MKQISYRRHRCPSSIIQHAVWLYFRFSLSYRDVEDMLIERGIDVSYEAGAYGLFSLLASFRDHSLECKGIAPHRDVRFEG